MYKYGIHLCLQSCLETEFKLIPSLIQNPKSKIIVHVKPSVFIDQFTNANTLSRTWFITEICSEVQLSSFCMYMHL